MKKQEGNDLMIEDVECALVNKNVIREVCKKARLGILNGNDAMKIRAEGMKYVLEYLDLWEDKEN